MAGSSALTAVAGAGTGGRASEIDSNSGVQRAVLRAVEEADELHPSLRQAPLPRVFLERGLHECRDALVVTQPLVLAAAKVSASPEHSYNSYCNQVL